MADSLFSIDGTVILVAGGAGGLGAPMAAAFAQRGAKVLIADIDASLAEKTAQTLAEKYKADARATTLDVVSTPSCATAVNQAVSAWGRWMASSMRPAFIVSPVRLILTIAHGSARSKSTSPERFGSTRCRANHGGSACRSHYYARVGVECGRQSALCRLCREQSGCGAVLSENYIRMYW